MDDKKNRKRVRVACVNCKKSKTACDTARPCHRCVTHGWEDSCVDRPILLHQATSSKTDTIPPKQAKHDQPNVTILPPVPLSTIKQEHRGSFRPIQSPEVDAEKQRLLGVIQQLKRNKQEHEAQIQELQRSLQTQAVFSGFALSRWKLHSGGCYLMSFSYGFSELSNYSPQVLSAGFRSLDLYPREYHHLFPNFHQFMASGQVESFITKMPVVRGTGEHCDVLAMLRLEFDREIAVSANVCMLTLAPNNPNHGEMQYFEPTYVKYRQSTTNAESPTQALSAATLPPASIPPVFIFGHSNAPQ